MLIEIVVVLFLILLNGLLAMSEMAVVSSRRARLEAMAGEGNSGARAALGLVDDPGRFLSTVQIGITLIGILAGAFGGATIAARLGVLLDDIPAIAPNGQAVALTLVVAVITYLSLVAGELVPKRVALANPERIASLVARPMRLLSVVAAPAVWLLNHSSDPILRLLGLGGARDSDVSEEEVRALIAEGARSGVFDPREREMIDGVLRLADRTVRATMTPRIEIAWIDRSADRAEIEEALKEARHRRLLVCEGTVDRAVGFLDVSDIALAALAGGPIDVAALMRKPLVVSENLKVLRLMDMFRKEGVHFALVVDEYGATEGVITAHDILEGVAGALPEGHDEGGPMLVARAEGGYLVDGLMPADEFAAAMGMRGLDEGDFDTVAGLVVHALGRLPQTGDRVAIGGLNLEVVDMDGRRIDKVLATRADAAPDSFG